MSANVMYWVGVADPILIKADGGCDEQSVYYVINQQRQHEFLGNINLLSFDLVTKSQAGTLQSSDGHSGKI
jgi:hypothetical protein